MKQTISVNLNRQVFYLDLDAYDILKNYLEDIKKYFAKDQTAAEVVDDIEARIAEKFGEIIGKSKKAIQLTDVTKIIEEMGSIDDIAGEENEKVNEEVKDVKRKLFRDPETKILAGTIAGLAYYLDVKSIWIRIIFFVLLVNPATFWLAIAGYMAAWLVIPEAKTSWEKLEMKGKPTTVNQLQTAIEEKASSTMSSVGKSTRNILQRIVSILIGLTRFWIVWACRLTGFFIISLMVGLIVSLVVGMVFVYFEPTIPYFDLSFLRAVSSPMLEILFVALGVIIITPLAFVIDLANSLMRWKWLVSIKKIIVMISVWIVAVMLFAGIAKINYPKYGPKLMNSISKVKYLTWIDETNSKILTVKDVADIDVSSVREVTITEGLVNEVKIVGNQLAIDEMNTSYTNGKLVISGHSEKWFGCQDCSGYVSSVRVEITAKNVENIKLNDDIDAIYYPVGGNVMINLEDRVGLKVVGKLNKATVSAGSNSVINMLETEISEANVTLKQATAKIWAKKINITGDSKSTLIYKGKPEIVRGDQDKSNQQKYSLSEDGYEKLDEAMKETVVTINGTKRKIRDLVWSEKVVKQNDNGFYNLYTALKLKEEDTTVYILWLVEKDGVITLKSSIKIDKWEKIDDLNLVNDKVLSATGQLYGPEIKGETVDLFIDRIKGVLELKPQPTTTPETD